VVRQHSHPADSASDSQNHNGVHWSSQPSSTLIADLLQTRQE